MDMQKRNSQIIAVVIAVVGAVGVAGAVYWWNTSRIQPVAPLTNTSSPAATSVSTGAGKVILATFSPEIDDRSDANDREAAYKIFSVQAPNLTEEPLGTIRSNIFVSSFGYADGKVYFVNGEGELSTYNLTTRKTERIALPDIKPVFGFLDDHSVYDFALEDATKLVYLQGACSEGAACHLKSYDFVTKKSSSIIDHLEKKFAINGETTIQIQRVGKDSAGTGRQVQLLRTRNTAETGFADVIAVSLDTRKDQVMKTVDLEADEQDAEADALFSKKFTCSDITGIQAFVDVPDTGDAEIQTTVIAGQGATKKYHPTYIVGCVMPK